MIKFEKIRWKNLLSTGNDWIEIDLSKNPMTLLVGVNGAGKSTLLDALTYVLFGKAYRNINLPQLVNSINQADMVVEVFFRVGVKQYMVRRGQKPSIFEIYENNKLLEQEAAKKDYQRILERDILGMSLHSFKQIVIVGTDGFTPFMRLDAGDRRNIIEDLLDISIFSTMNQILKDKRTATEADLDTVRADIRTTMEKIEIQKKHINASKQNTQQLVEQKTAELDKLLAQDGAVSAGIKQLNAENSILLEQIVDIGKVRDKIKKAEGFRIALQANKERLNTAYKFFENNDNCSTCKQPLDNKDQMMKKLLSDMSGIDAGLTDLASKAIEYETKLSELNNIAERANDNNTQLLVLNAEQKNVARQINVLREEIEALKSAPIADSIMEVSKELLTALQDLNTRKSGLIQLAQRQDIASALLRDSGIKAQIVSNYLPVINQQVNKYLNDLDFFVDFNIDSEFKETIKSRHRDAFSYENFSAGQKRRIDLALLFTWRAVSKLKNSVDTNILILDEVLDGSLDADGLEEFMKMLDVFCGNNQNAFVISHRGDVLADKFSHVMKFQLAGNFTEIEEE